jgi:small-conductance mechanosensitive channel
MTLQDCFYWIKLKEIQVELLGPSKYLWRGDIYDVYFVPNKQYQNSNQDLTHSENQLRKTNNIQIKLILLMLTCSGYMALEYAMHGQFFVKSDVFSFGVLVLEIVSRQKNNCFRNGENAEDLLSYDYGTSKLKHRNYHNSDRCVFFFFFI